MHLEAIHQSKSLVCCFSSLSVPGANNRQLGQTWRLSSSEELHWLITKQLKHSSQMTYKAMEQLSTKLTKKCFIFVWERIDTVTKILQQCYSTLKLCWNKLPGQVLRCVNLSNIETCRLESVKSLAVVGCDNRQGAVYFLHWQSPHSCVGGSMNTGCCLCLRGSLHLEKR